MADIEEYPPEVRAMDAISFIVAQTAKEIATRADVPMRVVRDVLKKQAYYIDIVDDRYRYDNGGEWCVAKEPLPRLDVPHRIIARGKEFEVTLSEPAPKPKPVSRVRAKRQHAQHDIFWSRECNT